MLWGGEFGRTPRSTRSAAATTGRTASASPWPAAASRAARRIGETSPSPSSTKTTDDKTFADPRNVEDLHATVLHALGIDFTQEIETPIGRPMALSKGKVIDKLLT